MLKHLDGSKFGRSPFGVSISLLHLFTSEIDLCMTRTELPWFGEAPGYYNTSVAGAPSMPQAPYMSQYPYTQQPGGALVIQPGVNGQLPSITQIPISQHA